QPDGSFARKLGPTGLALNDIEFQAGGNVGLAVGAGGQVFRSTDAGNTWSANLGGGVPVSRKDTTFTDCTAQQPLGDVYAVRFAGSARAWLFAEGSQLARSAGTADTVGSGGTWADANWQDDGNGIRNDADTCKVRPPYADGYSDGFFIPSNPDVGYIVGASYATMFRTTDNLVGAAQELTGEAGNAGSALRRLAGDPANPARMWSVAPENYGISVTGYTSDAYQTQSNPFKIANDSVRTFALPYDVDFAGGTVLAAGDAGMVLNSIDGANFFYNDAAGALATTPWRAVGLASGTQGAIGGVGGKLALTTTANNVPDLIAPTGTISISPATPRSGRPATFTLNAADTGGSGVDPASIRWTSAGLADQTGNPVSYTFPAQGFATVDVRFADRAGNTATATASFTVAKGSNALPVSFTGPGNKLSAKIKGRFIRVTMKGTITLPAGATSAACSKKVTLRIKKGKRVMAHRKAKLRYKASPSRCTFAKKIKLRRKKVGKTKKLRLTVSHPGNSVLRKSSKKLTLVIKK
ncbi:MAG: hypothetical protein ABWZ67_00945, partial [Solirubrobacteraceae bacterium]